MRSDRCVYAREGDSILSFILPKKKMERCPTPRNTVTHRSVLSSWGGLLRRPRDVMIGTATRAVKGCYAPRRCRHNV